jgi:hypothetical protein
MKPLYAARIEDLGPGDFVKVECTACGHAELLASDQLRIKGQALFRRTHQCSIWNCGCAVASAMRRGKRSCRL